MALRDYLNTSTRLEFYNYVMQSDQAWICLGNTATADAPAELWYFAAASMATDNGVTVIKPTAIMPGNPGRYLRWIQESDWNSTLNKPTVVSAFTNDAGYITGVTSGQITTALGYTPVNPSGTSAQYIRGNGTFATFPTAVSAFTNDSGYLTTVTSGQVTSALGFTPVTNARTITINGNAQDLTANRSWTLTTSDVSEGTNLYYTTTRFNTALATKTTTDLAEGTNLYYTAARFNTAFSGKSTTDLAEGTNLYFTNARARTAISLTTTGTSGAATYNNSTGVLNIPNYATPSASVINSTVSRSLSNAAGSTNQFTISATRNARVYYSVNVNWNISALISTASTILLEYNAGAGWIIVSQVSKNINLGLLQSGNDDLNVSGEIPANALVRIRPSVSTNSTITYVTGQEVLD